MIATNTLLQLAWHQNSICLQSLFCIITETDHPHGESGNVIWETVVRPSKTHLDFLISREKLQAAEVLCARHHIQPNLPDSQPQAVLAGQVAASYHSQPFEAPPSPSTAAGSKITCLPCQCYTPPHLNIKNENTWNPPPPFPINPRHEPPLWQKRNT